MLIWAGKNMESMHYLFARPTFRTLFVFILLTVTLITAAATGFNLFYRLTYAFISILILGYIWSWLMLVSVKVEIIERLSQTEVGESFQQKLVIINNSIIPKFGLVLKDMTDLPGHVGGIAININSFGRTEIDLNLKARKRGIYQIGPVEISNSDSFNLFVRSRKYGTKQSVIVYPKTVDLSNLVIPSAELYGDSLSRKKTYRVTPHANSVRDYVYGDSFNRIHWNSTARMGKLMSKEFDIGRSSEVWIIGDFDTEVQAGDLEYSTDEFVASIAASYANRYISVDLPVGIVAYGDNKYVISADYGKAQLDRIMEYLAIVKSTGIIPLQDVIADFERMWVYSTTVLIITSSASPKWVHASFELMKKGVDVKVIQLDSDSFGARFTNINNTQLLQDLGVPSVLVSVDDDIEQKLRPEFYNQNMELVKR